MTLRKSNLIAAGTLALACGLLADCSRERDEVVPHATGFSISLQNQSPDAVARVIGAAASKLGLQADPAVQPGHAINEHIRVLGSYRRAPEYDARVSIWEFEAQRCIEVQTQSNGQESPSESANITAALRAAVAEAFPGIPLSEDTCVRRPNSP